MPSVPSATICKELGCKAPRSKFNGYCLEHGGRDTYIAKETEERKESNAMYQTSHWQRQKSYHLSKNPLCACCLTRGIVTQAQHLDHVFPWRQIGKDAFTNNLFQSLCPSCHSYKTGLEQKGIIKSYHPVEHTYTIGDYGRICLRT